jgi:hypothetical protein
MKKLFVAILALLYLGSSTGMNLELHYCMGKLADWDLGFNKSESCGQCGMKKGLEKNKSCCKDESRFLKNASDQKLAQQHIHLSELISEAVVIDRIVPDFILVELAKKMNADSHAPPRTPKLALYLSQRSSLI